MRVLKNHIKNFFLLISGSIILFSCSREEAVPVATDFDLTIVNEDYSVPVQVALSNRSEGADTYEWSFEGGTPSNSVQRNPGIVTYSQEGTYNITLKASNKDGVVDEKSIFVDLDASIAIDFIATVQQNSFSPVIVSLENLSEGATAYQWNFQKGSPSSSNKRDPGEVLFSEPGEHKISLRIENGRETYEKDTIITVYRYW